MWFFLGIANAFFESISDAFAKRSTEKMSPWATAWCMRAFAVLLLVPLTALLEPVVELGPGFWRAFAVGVGVNSITSLLYLHALRDAPLSLALPLLKLSPMFILVTGPLTTGEHISPFGILGVVLTVAGTYALNFKERKGGTSETFHRALAQPGDALNAHRRNFVGGERPVG